MKAPNCCSSLPRRNSSYQFAKTKGISGTAGLAILEMSGERKAQIAVLIALPTELPIVLSVENRKFDSKHPQTEFERLERIHTSRIFHLFTPESNDLNRAIVVVAEGIRQGLWLAHFRNDFVARVVR